MLTTDKICRLLHSVTAPFVATTSDRQTRIVSCKPFISDILFLSIWLKGVLFPTLLAIHLYFCLTYLEPLLMTMWESTQAKRKDRWQRRKFKVDRRRLFWLPHTFWSLKSKNRHVWNKVQKGAQNSSCPQPLPCLTIYCLSLIQLTKSCSLIRPKCSRV